ncbi:MAG TPA: 16S rRNA (cytidine(1402)-2'-O)-methyltransferase [Burkholderiaceae bacterium]|nr:16S rRNA (cytidine(1402)-2'-O)-methyltransferase [Burkholderiaceae bacterium]
MGTVTQNLQQDRLIALSDVAAQELPAGSLYVVGLPIGNAADITLRALWVLANVDVIAAEDTRVTRPFLARYEINTPLLSAHQHNERELAPQIVERLARGERTALVTDAGTPGISDPGEVIVRAVLDAGQRVISVPGPSSATAALSVAGLGAGPFVFAGFLPSGAQQRERILRMLAADKKAFVLFEAPHRIADLVRLLSTALAPDRRVVLARELTKKFETVSVHKASDLAALRIEERGEYVVLVDVAASADTDGDKIDPSVARWLTVLLEEMPPSRAAAIAAKASGQAKSGLYNLALQLKSASA